MRKKTRMKCKKGKKSKRSRLISFSFFFPLRDPPVDFRRWMSNRNKRQTVHGIPAAGASASPVALSGKLRQLIDSPHAAPRNNRAARQSTPPRADSPLPCAAADGAASAAAAALPECDSAHLLALDAARLAPDAAFVRKFHLASADVEPYYLACARTLLAYVSCFFSRNSISSSVLNLLPHIYLLTFFSFFLCPFSQSLMRSFFVFVRCSRRCFRRPVFSCKHVWCRRCCPSSRCWCRRTTPQPHWAPFDRHHDLLLLFFFSFWSGTWSCADCAARPSRPPR